VPKAAAVSSSGIGPPRTVTGRAPLDAACGKLGHIDLNQIHVDPPDDGRVLAIDQNAIAVMPGGGAGHAMEPVGIPHADDGDLAVTRDVIVPPP
jgi:hypothetical protein